MELNPQFSQELQVGFSRRFPCVIKDSVHYIKGKDIMVPFPVVIKKDSIIHSVDKKDSIVYRFVPVSGPISYRVDTIKHTEEDERQINAISTLLGSTTAQRDSANNKVNVLTVEKRSLKIELWAIIASALLLLGLVGYFGFKRKTLPI